MIHLLALQPPLGHLHLLARGPRITLPAEPADHGLLQSLRVVLLRHVAQLGGGEGAGVGWCQCVGSVGRAMVKAVQRVQVGRQVNG